MLGRVVRGCTSVLGRTRRSQIEFLALGLQAVVSLLMRVLGA